jgi:hypothetical protein
MYIFIVFHYPLNKINKIAAKNNIAVIRESIINQFLFFFGIKLIKNTNKKQNRDI